jgi:hypothetical protein
MDALHVAIAVVNDLDMIISMNFRRIVKRKTVNYRYAKVRLLLRKLDGSPD